MANAILTWWILALVAIMTVAAGTVRPVTAIREHLGETDIGYWNLQNFVDPSISIACEDQVNYLGSFTLRPEQAWIRHWVIDSSFNEVFTCQFKWDKPFGSVRQSFVIWAQDDPESYLSTCHICEWQIQTDGFYFLQPNGQFVQKYSWVP